MVSIFFFVGFGGFLSLNCSLKNKLSLLTKVDSDQPSFFQTLGKYFVKRWPSIVLDNCFVSLKIQRFFFSYHIADIIYLWRMIHESIYNLEASYVFLFSLLLFWALIPFNFPSLQTPNFRITIANKFYIERTEVKYV